MNAKEANKIATVAAAKKEKENKEEAEKIRVTRIENEKKARKVFYQEFSRDVDGSIKWAVEDGKTTVSIAIGESVNSHTEAQKEFDDHKYLAEIKMVIARLRRNGFTVEQDTKSITHTTQHESSVPDYDYYTYHAFLKISW